MQLFAIEKGLLAIIFGILGLTEISQERDIKGKGLAIAGIILGIAFIIIKIFIKGGFFLLNLY
ncbi:MAG: hypothetical protein COZ65_00405 [Caldiserica bacterium CG_4_8_14_3_um_filter_35_18]|nr:MAG: hypothetical protein COZ65_00405 [Caldiserica bacterium CG_4_8_14_3_um_filter_35_18]